MQQQSTSHPPSRAAAAQYAAILDALDGSSSGGPTGRKGIPRDRAPRHPYRRFQLPLTIEQPGGGTTRRVVASRNLSSSGIGLLCDGYLHAGSQCSIMLVTVGGESVSVAGKVVHCRLVTGRTHEVGIQFQQAVDVSRFIAADASARPEGAELQPQALRGTVVLLDDSPMDRTLFKHHTASTGLTVADFGEAEPALRALREQRADLFVCDLYLDSGLEGIAVMRQARAAGFEGPILLVTAEQNVRKHAEALTAGAAYVLRKPYDGHTLLDILRRAREDGAAAVDPTLLVSRLAGRPESAELLRKFAAAAGALGDELRAAMSANDAAAFRHTCLRTKKAAVALGFDALAALLETALAGPGDTLPMTPARRLVAACRAIHALQF
jgi:DNA-binding response OmpR family regulator